MIDQNQSNTISKVFGYLFIVFGICILCFGIPFLFVENRNEAENTIMILAIFGGLMLLIGAYQTIKMANKKQKALEQYQHQIFAQLTGTDAPKAPSAPLNSETIETEQAEIYKPDLIYKWTYTDQEWKMMNRDERKRRIREGIWVSLLLAFIGGFVLRSSRDTSYWFGFFFSLGIGILISFLKVVLSSNLFSPQGINTIVFTTNALLINGKFKTIQDNLIHLQYLKPVKELNHQYLEFSIDWQTRNGITNDQLRIYVPEKYHEEMQGIIDYYRNKGVRIES
jgi:competence protein ComGF